MARSKRNKLVHLTKVTKKTKDWKEGIVTKVREAFQQYPYLYLLQHQNLRGQKTREVRQKLQESSRFIIGKRKLIKLALGSSPEAEYKQHLHQISDKVEGNVLLFYTRLPKDEVIQFFDEYEESDYVSPGFRVNQMVEVPEGPLFDSLGEAIPHTVEQYLRKNGMPTRLNKGVVELMGNFTVCQQGQKLSSQQATLLRALKYKLAKMKFFPIAQYNIEDASIEEYEGPDEEQEDVDDIDLEDG